MSSWFQVVLVVGGAVWLAGAALPVLAQSVEQVAAMPAAEPPAAGPPAAAPAAIEPAAGPAVARPAARTLPLAHVATQRARHPGPEQSGLAVYLMLNQLGPLPYAER